MSDAGEKPSRAGDMEPLIVGVDDDFRVREAIVSVVESAGYASLVFSSAQDFLDSETLARASCLITDLKMEGFDGIELQNRVRSVRRDLPIIFISAHGNTAVREKALAGGAIEFMPKPFDVAKLLEIIDVVVGRRRAKD
jgi:FixJ family two-component response regulator